MRTAEGAPYARAASSACARYVRTHPEDAVAWMRLGVSQAATRDPAAAASLEKAVQLGADTPNDLYNVACGYALLGQKEKALDWLEGAAAAGFDDKRLAESDTDLSSLRGEARFKAFLGGLRPSG